MNQKQLDKLFMDIAVRVSEESYCKRKQVGAILVKNNMQIISYGFNGTPSGEENCCEGSDGLTKPEVIHAEENVYRKLLQSTENSKDSTLYITLAPCEDCSALILDGGTVRVVYLNIYRCDKGISKLKRRGVDVSCINDDFEDRIATALKIMQDKISKHDFTPVSDDDLLFPSIPIIPITQGKQSCPKCGLDISGPIGYVCPDTACPVGLGGIHCSN